MKINLALMGIVILVALIACGDGLTKKQRHDKEYAENKANSRKYEADCYRGNERACRIVTYSIDQIRRYEVTYPRTK